MYSIFFLHFFFAVWLAHINTHTDTNFSSVFFFTFLFCYFYLFYIFVLYSLELMHPSRSSRLNKSVVIFCCCCCCCICRLDLNKNNNETYRIQSSRPYIHPSIYPTNQPTIRLSDIGNIIVDMDWVRMCVVNMEYCLFVCIGII